MSHDERKPVIGFSDHVRHKPGCTTTEDRQRLEIFDLGSGGIVLSMYAVTAQLICVFVFAYGKSQFSHKEAQIISALGGSARTRTVARLLACQLQISLVMRKPAFCLCEIKDADQLHSNCAADQRLCFRYTDSRIPLLPQFKISSL